jgi:hypothetical protein
MTILILKQNAVQRRIKLSGIDVVVGHLIMPGKCIFFKKEITMTVLCINIIQDDVEIAQSLYFALQNIFNTASEDVMKICWILIMPRDCPHLLKSNKMKQMLTCISETKHHEFRLIETNSQEEFPQELVDFIKE